METKSISRVKALQLMGGTKGKYFSAAFKKKDGSYREMVSRTGVKKFRKTQDKKSFAHNLDNPYFLVYDIKKKGYRVINLETLLWVKFGGTRYNVIGNAN